MNEDSPYRLGDYVVRSPNGITVIPAGTKGRVDGLGPGGGITVVWANGIMRGYHNPGEFIHKDVLECAECGATISSDDYLCSACRGES